MAAPSSAAAHEEARRTVSEFFVKSLNVILGSRMPSKYIKSRISSSSSSNSSSCSSSSGLSSRDSSSSSVEMNRCFNLVLLNTPLRNRCHLSALEPIVVDVLLLKQAPGKNKQQQQHQHHHHQQQQHHHHHHHHQQQQQQQQQHQQVVGVSQSLIERWVVQCVPWSRLQDERKQAAGTSKKYDHHSSRGKHKASFPSPCRKKVVRMLTIMLRALYSVTRLLPAFRLFQLLNCNAAGCSNFDLSYKVGTTLAAADNDAVAFEKFNFTPVETEMGRMCISVRYSSAANVVHAVERTSPIFSNIILDYVTAGVPVNPHYAVADTRLSVMTRTRSNDITMAAGRSRTAAVRRTRSSPFLHKEMEDIVCPFATDDELERLEPICCVQGTSHDAAVGALVRALQQAGPLRSQAQQLPLVHTRLQDELQQQQTQPLQQAPRRLRDAIVELGSYRT